VWFNNFNYIDVGWWCSWCRSTWDENPERDWEAR